MMKQRHGVPVYRQHIYGTGSIVDPYPHYTRIIRRHERLPITLIGG